jgi:hypothetical protein
MSSVQSVRVQIPISGSKINQGEYCIQGIQTYTTHENKNKIANSIILHNYVDKKIVILLYSITVISQRLLYTFSLNVFSAMHTST